MIAKTTYLCEKLEIELMNVVRYKDVDSLGGEFFTKK